MMPVAKSQFEKNRVKARTVLSVLRISEKFTHFQKSRLDARNLSSFPVQKKSEIFANFQ